MKTGNVVQEKSYDFALSVIRNYKVLVEKHNEFTLSEQLLRSGTSIGANTEEVIDGQTRKDFYAKMTIAYKEARECKYWIRLLRDSNYLSEDNSRALYNMLKNYSVS